MIQVIFFSFFTWWLRLAASIEAEEGEGFIGDASTSGTGVLAEDEDGDDDDEEILLVSWLYYLRDVGH